MLINIYATTEDITMTDRSIDPNRFDSIAGTWNDGGSQYITWWVETITEESKIEWNFGAGNKVKEFKKFDSAQKYFTMLLKQVS